MEKIINIVGRGVYFALGFVVCFYLVVEGYL